MKKLHHTILLGGALLFALPLTVSAQTLLNRWSFFSAPAGGTTVTDSVSGVVATLQGNAVLDGSEVGLDGTTSYVSLSSNLLAGVQSVSLEGWVNSAPTPDNVCLFEFSDGNGTGNAYLRYVIHDGGNTDNQFELANVSGYPSQQLHSAVGWGGVPVHVVCVYDPANGLQAIYTNGVLEVLRSFPTNQTPLSSVSTNEASLGRSPWYAYGDPYMAGTISEFRIWNGALNPLQVAALDVAGQGTVSTNYGAVTAIQLQVSFQMSVNGNQTAAVLATASGVPYPVNIAPMASYSSANTNILSVNNQGVIRAVAVGSASISASYDGLTNSQVITVNPPSAVLTNRWSFSEAAGSTTVTDSISGAVATLAGTAAVNGNGQVTLDGSTAAYVALPGNLVSKHSSVVIETWATLATNNPDNAALFEFSDETGTGANYLRCVPAENSDGDNYVEIHSSSTTKVQASPGLDGRTVHVACIYDPVAQVEAVFTNGTLENYATGITIPLSTVSTNGGTLGRSPWYTYASDANCLNGSIDEFRIYSGEKTAQQIALDYLAGPNAIATNNAGPLMSIALQASATMQFQASQSFKVLATYANLPNFDLIANNFSGSPVPGLVVTSSNTNVVMVNNTQLTAVGSGTVTITAVYQGLTSSSVVTVLNPPLPPLLYRWSFNETSGSATVTDSIQGAVGTLQGTAAVNGSGQVVLDGSQGCYVLLPGNLLTGLTNVTIEAWVTNAVTPDNTCLFSFDDASGTGGHYVRDVLKDTSNARNLFELSSGAGSSALAGHPGLGGQSVHLVCIYDPVAGIQAMYTNGVLFASQSASAPLSGVATNEATLGQSPWFAYGDPYLAGSIDEFRIYGGRLLPSDVAAADIIGPNQVLTSTARLTASKSGGNLILNWPVAASGFTLESSPTLGPAATWTPVGATPVVIGVTNQVTITPDSTRFYRLER